jgi:hypothetical protein
MIYALIAVIFIGIYVSIPAMTVKMETARITAPIGAYAGIDRRDTIVLDGLRLKHKYGNDPLNNYSSAYIISTAMNEKNFWGKIKNGFSHVLFGQKINIDNEILTLNYPVRDSYYNIQPNNSKKTKKKQSVANPKNTNIINRYFFNLKSDTIILVPVNSPTETFRYLRFANFY